MSDTRPIGVFDSGMGGLTVVRELFRQAPDEQVLYLGDTARCPYGGRSNDTIRMFGMQDARFLMEFDIKMLIVACNTVSSVALDYIRDYARGVPVIGVVQPGCRAAVARSAARKVGIIGTAATIRAQSYTKGIHAIDPEITVAGRECPLFVPLVEEGLTDGEIPRLIAQHYLYELKDTGIDSLILGCTHYPLLYEVIQETVSSSIELIDSAVWTAKEAAQMLGALDARAAAGTNGAASSRFFVTDLTENFAKNAGRFLGQELSTVERIKLEELTKYT